MSAAVVRCLGRVGFEDAWRRMREFNAARRADTPDEIWLVEHDPVFTLGLAGRPRHVLDAGTTPVVACDRGGQVTWHGPGQAIAYVLLDLRRARLGVRELVHRLEAAAIAVAGRYGIEATRRDGMPGVYVAGAKLAAVGLRVARGCSYHGLALNVDADLEAFTRIDPCGYPGLAATRLADLGVGDTIDAVQQILAEELLAALAPQPRIPVHA